MKKALSLVLALLMIVGCMSFVVSAEEAPATNYNMADVIAEYGLTTLNLSKPTTTAPAQDGTIGATEYQYKSVVTAGATAAAAAGASYNAVFYGADSTPVNYTATTANAVMPANATITEYFDYDAEWVYYAMTLEDPSNAYASTNRWNISFERVDHDLKLGEVNGLLSNAGNTKAAPNAVCFGYDKTETSAKTCTNDVYDALEPQGMGRQNANGFNTVKGKTLLFNNTVGQSGTTTSKTFEIKFSRRYIGDTSNIFSIAPSLQAAAGTTYARTHLLAKLTEPQQTALTNAGFTIGTAGGSVRFLKLGADDVRTAVAASVRCYVEQGDQFGLRFKTTVQDSYIAARKAEGYEVAVGTLIAPTDLLAGAPLTMETATKLNVAAVVDNPFEDGNGYNVYAGSITKIKEDNLMRAFTAVGYVALTKNGNTEYVYSGMNTTERSAYLVASHALQYDAGDFTADQQVILARLVPIFDPVNGTDLWAKHGIASLDNDVLKEVYDNEGWD